MTTPAPEHTVCSECRIDGTCVNDTPAPEPVEPMSKDAPKAQCPGCGRFTWDPKKFYDPCGMTQPDGSRCAGQFTGPKFAPEPVEAEYDENGVPTDAYVDACIRAGGAEPIRDEAFRPPTPEPVEVAMSAARFRGWLSERHNGPSGFLDDARAIMAEYDRLKAENAELKEELEAEQDRYDELLRDIGGVSPG